MRDASPRDPHLAFDCLTPRLTFTRWRKACVLWRSKPGDSTGKTLDRAVAKAVFGEAGIAAHFSMHGIGDGNGDGISIKELNKTLARECDVIASFPRSTVADAANAKLSFSQGYLHAAYVSIETPGAELQDAASRKVAATYGSPAQLITVQQHDVTFDLENTSASTVEAVASGRARRAIVWYPAVVAYRNAHLEREFAVSATRSPYADWQLIFAFGPRGAPYREKIDATLERMKRDGRLQAMTRAWALPANMEASHRKTTDGIVLADMNAWHAGRLMKVANEAINEPPPFMQAQTTSGKTLYSASCAKCHGAQLQGVTAPALQGPSFAPPSNLHLTVGSIFTYMATNMPVDRPGKMKNQDYADIMAFLLYSNGYKPGSAKMTADTARSSTLPLNAGSSK